MISPIFAGIYYIIWLVPYPTACEVGEPPGCEPPAGRPRPVDLGEATYSNQKSKKLKTQNLLQLSKNWISKFSFFHDIFSHHNGVEDSGDEGAEDEVSNLKTDSKDAEDAEDEVSHVVTPLGHRTGDDRGARGCEGRLAKGRQRVRKGAFSVQCGEV